MQQVRNFAAVYAPFVGCCVFSIALLKMTYVRTTRHCRGRHVLIIPHACANRIPRFAACYGTEGGCTHVTCDRSRMIIRRPSHPYNVGTEHVGFPPTKQTLLGPRRCLTSCMRGERHPTKNRLCAGHSCMWMTVSNRLTCFSVWPLPQTAMSTLCDCLVGALPYSGTHYHAG